MIFLINQSNYYYFNQYIMFKVGKVSLIYRFIRVIEDIFCIYLRIIYFLLPNNIPFDF